MGVFGFKAASLGSIPPIANPRKDNRVAEDPRYHWSKIYLNLSCHPNTLYKPLYTS